MILNKRIFRELKNNFSRYFSIFLLLLLGMCVVVGLASSTDSIIFSVNKSNQEANIEDGSFSMFTPISDNELKSLEELGVVITKAFFVDVKLNDEKALRIFTNRNSINMPVVEEGVTPSSSGEIFIEKHFAKKNNLEINNLILLYGNEYKIVGIGSIPDYNFVIRNVSDVTSDTQNFSIALVCEEDFDSISSNEMNHSTVNYNYSFKLKDSMTNERLKENLKKIKFDTEDIDNKYISELIENAEKDKNELLSGLEEATEGSVSLTNNAEEFYDATKEIQKGVNSLYNAVSDMSIGIGSIQDGLNDLVANNKDIISASTEIFDTILSNANEELQNEGVDINLTRGNYATELDQLIKSGKLTQLQITDLQKAKQDLFDMEKYVNGIESYTSGVDEAYNGTKDVSTGLNQLQSAQVQFNNGLSKIDQNSRVITLGASNIFQSSINMANNELNALGFGVNLMEDSFISQLDDIILSLPANSPSQQAIVDIKTQLVSLQLYSSGVQEYTSGVSYLNSNAGELSNGLNSLKTGVSELESGLSTLNRASKDIEEGSSLLFNNYLNQLSDQFKENDIYIALNRENYEYEIDNLISNGILSEKTEKKILELTHQISKIDEFNNGILEYVNGTTELLSGIEDLSVGVSELLVEIENFQSDANTLVENSLLMKDAAMELSDGLHKIQDSVNKFSDELLNNDSGNLIGFLSAGDNPRINNYKDDAVINKQAALVVGALFLILIGYILSVFIINNIDRESVVIGALYSMGYKKDEIIRHFLIIPSVISALGGVAGTFVGFSLVSILSKSNSEVYSYIQIQQKYPIYLFAYGIVIPIFISVFVNFFVINKKLSIPALKLLKKNSDNMGIIEIDLKDIKYSTTYKIRLFFREIRGYVVLSMGIFLAILLMVFGFTIKGAIDNMPPNIDRDISYSNMYLLQYPENIQPKDDYCYVESLTSYSNLSNTNIELTLMGISDTNQFFDFLPPTESNTVIISSSTSEKFNWNKNDIITLYDNISDKYHSFRVSGITLYSNGLYIFMNIDEMRKHFNVDTDYYNLILSNEEEDIEAGRILSITTKADIEKTVSTFQNMMKELIVIIVSVSIIMLFIVIYILVKVIIDNASVSISLLKIFGYTEKEVNRLYLGNNHIILLFTTLFGIPISKIISNLLFPHIGSNIAMGFDTSLSASVYISLVSIIILSYIVVCYFLNRYLRKISVNEVLRNRE